MALRFRIRHTHKTVADFLETGLAELGWVDPPVNFDTTAMTFLEFQPEEAGKAIAANTVAITFGDEPPTQAEELGDGLRSVAYPLQVDVYGANQSIAASIASDVKDLLSDAHLAVRDFTADAAGVVTSDYIEIDRDGVSVLRPPGTAGISDFRRFWRIVEATALTYHQD